MAHKVYLISLLPVTLISPGASQCAGEGAPIDSRRPSGRKSQVFLVSSTWWEEMTAKRVWVDDGSGYDTKKAQERGSVCSGESGKSSLKK